jgi:hypothetical protein
MNDPVSVDLLLDAASTGDEELPPPGMPRSEWTDVQVLLSAAYRLADLADMVACPHERVQPAPVELVLALKSADAVLDSQAWPNN